jgi:hypothetical protein
MEPTPSIQALSTVWKGTYAKYPHLIDGLERGECILSEHFGPLVGIVACRIAARKYVRKRTQELVIVSQGQRAMRLGNQGICRARVGSVAGMRLVDTLRLTFNQTAQLLYFHLNDVIQNSASGPHHIANMSNKQTQKNTIGTHERLTPVCLIANNNTNNNEPRTCSNFPGNQPVIAQQRTLVTNRCAGSGRPGQTAAAAASPSLRIVWPTKARLGTTRTFVAFWGAGQLSFCIVRVCIWGKPPKTNNI